MAGAPQWTVAWVTGASGGIGRELVTLLAARGVKIAATARGAERLEALAAAVDGVSAFPADVTQPAALRDCVGDIEARLGPIDLVLVGAGAYAPFELRNIDVDGSRRMMAVNVDGVVNTLAAVLPAMLARRRGHVVLMGSLFGYSGWPGNGGYGASKAAVINLAESLKLELAGTGVDVTVVNPGFVDTELNASYQGPKHYVMKPEKAARRIMKKLDGRPYEIAFPGRVALFLKTVRLLPWALSAPLVRRLATAAQKGGRQAKGTSGGGGAAA